MKFSIDNIRIFSIQPSNGIVAFASAILNGGMYIGSIAIHEKKNQSGYRLTYPTRKSKGKDLNIFHPISQECSQIIDESIIAEYLKNAKTVNNARYDNSHTPDPSL
jgi:DNA-binding cell septation regulator SpoVG